MLLWPNHPSYHRMVPPPPATLDKWRAIITWWSVPGVPGDSQDTEALWLLGLRIILLTTSCTPAVVCDSKPRLRESQLAKGFHGLLFVYNGHIFMIPFNFGALPITLINKRHVTEERKLKPFEKRNSVLWYNLPSC